MRNTLRQLVISRSCVATIGATASPISEIMHWNMPLFMPRRFGCEASTATATPVDATGPSKAPIRARISSRLTKPCAPNRSARRLSRTPMIAGTSTLRRPTRSDRKPITIADTPHATARMPTRLPRSSIGQTQLAHHRREQRRQDEAVEAHQAEGERQEQDGLEFIGRIPLLWRRHLDPPRYLQLFLEFSRTADSPPVQDLISIRCVAKCPHRGR